ncbi:MAG: class I SAM-dependent methyltransferase [Planctomycetes bacterium]|nr:class I SAM-dependent methyltransferase [Planctomycetota bacterium]
MSARPGFDLDAAFDDDYLHFYAPYTTEERSDADAALIGGLLGLRSGETVLDLACGTGRIAVRFAQHGCRVVGLDRSPRFLAIARETALARGVEAQWFEGDQRRLHFVEEFDAVLSWFTSFGYDDDATSRDILARVQRALVPGGRFLLETMNVFQVAFDGEREVKKVGRDRMVDRKRFDAVGGFVVHDRTIEREDRPPRAFTFAVRLFTVPELRGWLEAAGFRDVQAFGGDGEPFCVESERLIVVATKPA